MRIEVDEETEQVLDRIRRQEYSIYGKGHSGTVKFLAKFYEEHKSLETLLEKHLGEIPAVIQREFLNAMRGAVTNILSAGGGQEPSHKSASS